MTVFVARTSPNLRHGREGGYLRRFPNGKGLVVWPDIPVIAAPSFSLVGHCVLLSAERQPSAKPLLCQAAMCSRYSLTSPAEAVRSYFKVGGTDEWPPRYNIAPTQPTAIVRVSTAGARELTLVRWGLIPSWVKDPNAFTTLLNARSDTIVTKPSFKAAMRYRRCLVPADGFYEWTGGKGSKQPWYIRPVGGAGPIGFAGLWEHWMHADGSELETMAIVTTDANAEVSKLHDRMPVILAPGDFDAWLDVRGVEAGEAARLLRPAPAGMLELYPVNKALGNSRNDGPGLQVPIPWQGTLL